MLPRVILHNVVSVDGRIDGFEPDLGLYYGLAARLQEDATLVGADTMLKAGNTLPEEGEGAPAPPVADPADTRPLLVIPDSRGRFRGWHAVPGWGYWRASVALCSRSTPQSYLDYLEERHVHTIIAGDDHVDLRAALEELSARFGIRRVRTDSGGTLNGVLLHAGLVDEISVLVHPALVGDQSPGSLFRSPGAPAGGAIPLRLVHCEGLDGGVVWLRYEVVR